MSHYFPVCSSDKRIACEEEFSDSDEEGEGGRKNSSNFKKAKRVKTEDEKEKDPEEKKGEFGWARTWVLSPRPWKMNLCRALGGGEPTWHCQLLRYSLSYVGLSVVPRSGPQKNETQFVILTD